MASLSASQLTQMQELGSAWIFKRALKDNIRYSTWEDILNDPKYDELGGKNGVYPDIDQEWLKTFFLQQQKMLDEFANPKFTEFNRDGGFMKYISDLVKNKFKIAKKDAWNPADIWCIKDQSKVIRDIEKVVDSGQLDTLQELNVLLKTLFTKRIVVGISLKKISGKQAKYEEINVKDTLEYLNDDYTFDVNLMKIDLSMKPGTAIKFNTQDTSIFLDAMEDGKKIKYKYQIKGISTSKLSTLKWEPTSSAATAARLGKAPVAMVMESLKKVGITFVNSPKNYPKSAAEFNANQKDYVKMWKDIKGKVQTNITTEKEFVSNMQKVFMVDPQIANSKLMQLTFLHEITSLNKRDLDSLMTEITLLAQKKGKRFGPFGKLY